ncbi:MAG: hypothetical protein FWD81_03640 [Methanomassiliicoccaceae archaeon]|nr:hypothetical protein [Methanomassiliicoccaceae archaeon]
MYETFIKYYDGATALINDDKKVLDVLVVSGLIDYEYKGKDIYPKASIMGMKLRKADRISLTI